jgi:hypothetical protein
LSAELVIGGNAPDYDGFSAFLAGAGNSKHLLNRNDRSSEVDPGANPFGDEFLGVDRKLAISSQVAEIVDYRIVLEAITQSAEDSFEPLNVKMLLFLGVVRFGRVL